MSSAINPAKPLYGNSTAQRPQYLFPNQLTFPDAIYAVFTASLQITSTKAAAIKIYDASGNLLESVVGTTFTGNLLVTSADSRTRKRYRIDMLDDAGLPGGSLDVACYCAFDPIAQKPILGDISPTEVIQAGTTQIALPIQAQGDIAFLTVDRDGNEVLSSTIGATGTRYIPMDFSVVDNGAVQVVATVTDSAGNQTMRTYSLTVSIA